MEDGPGWAPFDPATGDWAPAAPAPALLPDAPRRGLGPILWTVLLGVDLALLGIGFGAQVIATFKGQGSGLGGSTAELRTQLWTVAAFNLLSLGAIPFAWVVGTRAKPWEGAVRYLRLHDPGRGLLHGAAWGGVTLAGLMALGLLLEALHYDSGSGETDAILKAMTPALSLALAFSAAVGEEIFFRGLLQKKLGVWGQAALFGLFHLSYGTPLQVIVPALLGLLYGWLIRRGVPLWTTMAAHFVYDYVQLSSPFWLPT